MQQYSGGSRHFLDPILSSWTTRDRLRRPSSIDPDSSWAGEVSIWEGASQVWWCRGTIAELGSEVPWSYIERNSMAPRSLRCKTISRSHLPACRAMSGRSLPLFPTFFFLKEYIHTHESPAQSDAACYTISKIHRSSYTTCNRLLHSADS